MTTAGCHMTGTLQVGVAEEVQAFLDKVRAKRKGGNVGVKKVFRKLETRISSISS